MNEYEKTKQEMVEDFMHLQEDLRANPKDYDTQALQNNIDWFKQCLDIISSCNTPPSPSNSAPNTAPAHPTTSTK